MATEPAVSIVVANHNGAQFLSAFLKCLLRQSLSHIEIIVIDDASTDGSVAILQAAAKDDPRIRFEALKTNSGPGAARNAGFALAKGQWIAVIDSDDFVHPKRLEKLVAVAEREGADIVADDLLVFYEDGTPPHRFLQGKRAKTAGEVSLEDYIRENSVLGRKPALGFLKPLFKREALHKHGLRYNESLRIGEDYDLVLRALGEGLKFWVEPMPYYLYRKHSRSTSQLLKTADIDRMSEADARFERHRLEKGPDLRRALQARNSSLARARAWNELVDAIKARKAVSAAAIVLQQPSVLPLLRWPFLARLKRMRHKYRVPSSRDAASTREKSVCLISRQRLVSGVSGSSHYVLSLAKSLREAGYQLHLIQPAPTVFGRLPILIRRSESRVFQTTRIRGGLVIGPLMIAKDPRIFGALFHGAFVRLARKAGFQLEDRPAPYSVAAPWEADDYLFLARHAPRVSDVIIYDYAFQTDAAPYALRPDSRSFVLMHDLISSRKDQFARVGGTDAMPVINEDEELRLLSGADVIVAIQDEEADFVRKRTNGRQVLSVPIALNAAKVPHPGTADRLLFVGTKTAPNVVGLNWFLSEVWPRILREMPGVRLDVAGSINRMIGNAPQNVRLLGVVPDLKPLYESAGVVISPLLAGSGLKIKLIEALANGKAIVATSPTVQGVGSMVDGAVFVADEAADFARAVLALLRDDALRERHAARALEVVTAHFSPEVCYKNFVTAVGDAFESGARVTSLSQAEPEGVLTSVNAV